MNVGMLWFDNDPRTALPVKVERAADYYRHKYGVVPNLCLDHPSMLGEGKGSGFDQAGKVPIRANKVVLPGHLWIGTEEKNGTPN